MHPGRRPNNLDPQSAELWRLLLHAHRCRGVLYSPDGKALPCKTCDHIDAVIEDGPRYLDTEVDRTELVSVALAIVTRQAERLQEHLEGATVSPSVRQCNRQLVDWLTRTQSFFHAALTAGTKDEVRRMAVVFGVMKKE